MRRPGDGSAVDAACAEDDEGDDGDAEDDEDDEDTDRLRNFSVGERRGNSGEGCAGE
ncbi:hypothetical protein SCA03_11550 [Streptomyces cacaoi]|uniref:Uncharacterized protein n=1 Tax=Streptomyces cacaoi TaxID=1898 RepID=A0A4Y3QT58_STRCI|nr:hypothetical protein SCA03_11550 [Streptomyces cacaoi]